LGSSRRVQRAAAQYILIKDDLVTDKTKKAVDKMGVVG